MSSCMYVLLYWSFKGRLPKFQYTYMYKGVPYAWSFLTFFWNQHANFNQLVLQDYQMDSNDFWCKMKLRSCLFQFCVLFTTFLCWKPAKQSREVWNHVFFAASFEKNTNGPNWLRSLPWSIRLELYSINRHIQPRTNFSCFYSQKVVTHQFLAELEPSSRMRIEQLVIPQ